MKSIKITDRAYKCLQMFREHPCYEQTPSAIIEDLTEEWCCREGCDIDIMLENVYDEKELDDSYSIQGDV